MNDKTKILLGLRNNAHRVQLIVPNGATKAVLGTSNPEEEQRRVDVAAQWNKDRSAPRQSALAGIKIPLEQRTQTILYYQLTASEQQQLNGGQGALSNSRNSRPDVQHTNIYPSDDCASHDSD